MVPSLSTLLEYSARILPITRREENEIKGI